MPLMAANNESSMILCYPEMLALPAILPPRQLNDHDVEHRQCEHSESATERQSISLVDNEKGQQDEHARVGPEPSAEDFEDEHDLCETVRKQIHGPEPSCSPEVRDGLPKMHCDKVVRVFRELVLCQCGHELAHGDRRNNLEQDAAYDFEDGVGALERQAHSERQSHRRCGSLPRTVSRP